jgi:hypothetical protein
MRSFSAGIKKGGKQEKPSDNRINCRPTVLAHGLGPEMSGMKSTMTWKCRLANSFAITYYDDAKMTTFVARRNRMKLILTAASPVNIGSSGFMRSGKMLSVGLKIRCA